MGLVLGWVAYSPDNNVHVIACDVGQGDGILIQQAQTQILIDGGPDEAVLSCLSRHMPFWDREVELVVLTNGDADHVTGLIEVVKRYQVGKLVTNDLIKDTDRFRLFEEVVQERGVEKYAPKVGDQIKVGDLRFDVLWPNEAVLGSSTMYSANKGNEQSVVVKLSYGEFDVLLTGDIGEETEDKLMGLSEVEVLKVGHHGSRYSSSSEFLERVSPQVAVISAGEKNNYGHPAPDALQRLEAVGAQILRTDELGDVEIVSDGQRYWIVDR